MPTDKPKPTFDESLKTLVAWLRSTVQKIAPHFGFIYLIVMLIGITAVVYIVSLTMQSTDIGEGTATNEKLSEYTIVFDRATIAKVQTLSNQNGSLNVALPSGRINPFSESVY